MSGFPPTPRLRRDLAVARSAKAGSLPRRSAKREGGSLLVCQHHDPFRSRSIGDSFFDLALLFAFRQAEARIAGQPDLAEEVLIAVLVEDQLRLINPGAPVRLAQHDGGMPEAACRTRTDDLLITNQLLYQLS